jgi:hypothetical protein
LKEVKWNGCQEEGKGRQESCEESCEEGRQEEGAKVVRRLAPGFQ